MNPYEEPISHLERPAEDNEFKGIRWLAILASGLIYFVGSSVLQYLWTKWYAEQASATSQTFAILAFLVPWGLGAALLASFAKFRWVLHGLIFSMIPPLLTVIASAFYTGFDPMILPFLALWFVESLALALLTMWITRLILRMKLRN